MTRYGWTMTVLSGFAVFGLAFEIAFLYGGAR